jgi:hypothetical protein
MEPKVYNLKKQKYNTSFSGITLYLSRTSGSVETAVNLVGCTPKLEFKQTSTSPVLKTLLIGTGITISNPAAGELIISNFQVDLTPGKYFYSLTLTLSDNSTNVYLIGTLEVAV